MTMEDRSGGIVRAAPATTNATACSVSSDASYPLQRSVKRSFDVAFLVAPDENLQARRQNERLRLVSTDRLTSGRRDLREHMTMTIATDRDTGDKLPQNLTTKHYTDNSPSPPYVSSRLQTTVLPASLSPDQSETKRYDLSRTQKTPSPPVFGQTILGKSLDSAETLLAKSYDDAVTSSERINESRSAFTKVAFATQRNGFDSNQVSTRSSLSPDRTSYQTSVSPPVNLTGPSAYKYAPFPAKMAYPFLQMSPDTSQQNSILDNLKIPQISQPPKIPSPKMTSAAFRPELSPVYSNLPYNPITVFPPMAEALVRPRFLATAGVAGLLPPSFAALALPAQNVCAKCNLSFRMTSDLVYHMRSHHKNESVGEAARRRREEKLRCPVCDESFRERHHLTRHMTAHQDKESDAIADQVEIKRRATPVHGK